MQKLSDRKELGIQETVKRPVWLDPLGGGDKGSGGDELTRSAKGPFPPSAPPCWAGQAHGEDRVWLPSCM